jgi:hypothetical protein
MPFLPFRLAYGEKVVQLLGLIDTGAADCLFDRAARVNDFETPTDRNLVSHRVKEPGKVGSNSIRKKIVGHI